MFTKEASRNTQLNMFFFNRIKVLGSHAVVLVKTFPLMYKNENTNEGNYDKTISIKRLQHRYLQW